MSGLELPVALCFCELCQVYFRSRKCDKCGVTLRTKHAREIDLATELCELLSEHVSVCKVWEKHYIAVADKALDKDEEKVNHKWLRENATIPFLEQVRQSKFTYADIIEIIPPAFETTTKQRKAILSDLVSWADKTYGCRAN